MNYVSDCEPTASDVNSTNLFQEVIDHSDRILGLKHKEDNTYYYHLYLDQRVSGGNDYHTDTACFHAINPELRGRISTWMIRVVDHCNLATALAEISLSLFDRCMARCGEIIITLGNKMVWLLGISALHLAIKLNHHNHHKQLPSKLILRFCIYEFTIVQIGYMEVFITRTLRWYLYPPISSEFAYSFTALLSAGTLTVSIPVRLEIWKRAKTIIQKSLEDSLFVPFRASSTALAAVIFAVESTNLPLSDKNKLTCYLKRDIGTLLLGLHDGSEEAGMVEFIRLKFHEIARRTLENRMTVG